MRQDEDLKSLDEMIHDFGGSSEASHGSTGSCELLLEHLQAARRGLLGMTGEYRSSLQFAQDSLSCISDDNARGEAKKMLQSLLRPRLVPLAPAL